MSDEVKPKRHRRRQRSRKKKPSLTAESIHPERAPLGFQPSVAGLRHSLHHGSPSVTAYESECSGGSPEQRYLYSPSLDCLPWDPAPTPSPSKTTNPLSLRGRSGYLDGVESLHIPSQNILRSPRSFPSTEHLESPGRYGESPSEHFSPASVSHRPCASRMAQHRLPLKPYGREAMAYGLPPAGQTASLDNLDDLASSRPIPLSALSSRASSRNKRSKVWKPLQLDDDEDSPEPASSMKIPDPAQYNPSSHSVLHQSSGGHSSISHHQGHILQPPLHLHDLGSEDTDGDVGQPWLKAANADFQRNPLSYSGGHDFQSQSHGGISHSPFLKANDCIQLEAPGWFANGPQAHNGRPSLGGIQPHYSLPFPGEKPPSISDYPLRTHEPAPSNPHIRPSYTVPHHQSNQVYADRPGSMPHFSSHESQYDHKDDHGHFRANGVYKNIQGGASVTTAGTTVLTDRISRMQIPDPSLPQASDTAHPSKPAEPAWGPDTDNVSRNAKRSDSREEVTAYLKRVVQAAEMDTKPTALPDPFIDGDMPLKEEYQEPKRAAGSKQQPHEAADESARVSEEISSITRQLGAINDQFKSLCAASVPESQVIQAFKDDTAQRPNSNPETVISKDSEKILRPPPGLPIKKTPGPCPGIRSKAEVASLEEANHWFHTDNRGEERLREEVAEIAQAHAQSCSRLQGAAADAANIETPRQTTLLLGNAIANLQSYMTGDRKEQSQNFANFGSVPDHYCESSHGGRRSYFERDPGIAQCRQPTVPAFPVFGQRSQRRLPVLSRFRQSPMSEGWDVFGGRSDRA